MSKLSYDSINYNIDQIPSFFMQLKQLVLLTLVRNDADVDATEAVESKTEFS